MTVPQEIHWRMEDWNMDTPYAYKHFLGKSLEEASALLAEDSRYYGEDIMWMPVICFRFYIVAFARYLRAETSRTNDMDHLVFVDLIRFRLDDVIRSSNQVIEEIRTALQCLPLDEALSAKAASCLERIDAAAPRLAGTPTDCNHADRAAAVPGVDVLSATECEAVLERIAGRFLHFKRQDLKSMRLWEELRHPISVENPDDMRVHMEDRLGASTSYWLLVCDEAGSYWIAQALGNTIPNLLYTKIGVKYQEECYVIV